MLKEINITDHDGNIISIYTCNIYTITSLALIIQIQNRGHGVNQGLNFSIIF